MKLEDCRGEDLIQKDIFGFNHEQQEIIKEWISSLEKEVGFKLGYSINLSRLFDEPELAILEVGIWELEIRRPRVFSNIYFPFEFHPKVLKGHLQLLTVLFKESLVSQMKELKERVHYERKEKTV